MLLNTPLICMLLPTVAEALVLKVTLLLSMVTGTETVFTFPVPPSSTSTLTVAEPEPIAVTVQVLPSVPAAQLTLVLSLYQL